MPCYLSQLESAQVIIREGLFTLLRAPWACLAEVAPQCAPVALHRFRLLRPAGVAIGWESCYPGTFSGSFIYMANMRFYLNCMLVREWLGKANGDYGGAKDPELPLKLNQLWFTHENLRFRSAKR